MIYTALALALVAMLALVTLSQRQPPPPTIAEFAPQAVSQITDSPSDRAGRVGAGAGADGDEAAGSAVVVTSPAPIEVSRVRRCVGDPPRQIEDPQSPPCVPYWSGDNGGATSVGVTRDEIRVAAPLIGNSEDTITPMLETFFNQRFEFYGRKLRLLSRAAPAFGAGSTEEERAAAVEVAAQNVFASLHYPLGSNYNEELARLGVVSHIQYMWLPERDIAEFDPYVWQYTMGIDQALQNLAGWACARLSGRNATHAGPVLASKQRTFALVFDEISYSTYGRDVGIDDFKRMLQRCGSNVEIVLRSQRHHNDPQRATEEVLQLSAANVTTVVCLCQSLGLGHRMRAATAQGYFPEWVITNYELIHSNAYLRDLGGGSDQRAHMFGVAFEPRQVSPHAEPYRTATSSVDPSYNDEGTFEFTLNRMRYWEMLLMAAGLQMAGPNLTAETFRKGLQETAFPNPAHPIMAGSVGFRGDHTMTDDGVEFWWSDAAISPYPSEGPGAVCYLNGGVRHANGNWPTEPAAFFSSPCDTGAI